jgi:hypothetical protein
VKPTNELEVFDADMESWFRSDVGKLLYLIKHPRLEITNVVRKLAEHNDGATLAANKKMLRVIRFVLDTRLFCLKMEQKKNEED